MTSLKAPPCQTDQPGNQGFADIAGKDDLGLPLALVRPELGIGGAEQVAGIILKLDPNFAEASKLLTFAQKKRQKEQAEAAAAAAESGPSDKGGE